MADTIDVTAGNERRKALLQRLMQQAGFASSGLGSNAAGFGLAVSGGLRAIPQTRPAGLNFTHPSQVAAQFLPGLGGAVGRQGDVGHQSPEVGMPVPAPHPVAAAPHPAPPASPHAAAGTPAPAPVVEPAPQPSPAPVGGSTPASGASSSFVPLGGNVYYNPATGQITSARPDTRRGPLWAV